MSPTIKAEIHDSEETPRSQLFAEKYSRTPRRTILGHGAFGTVYAVLRRDDPQARFVAKEMQVWQLCQKKRDAALREGELLKTLTHPNVVACVDCWLTGSSFFIVMECAAGGDLSRHICLKRAEEDGLFPEVVVVSVMVQVTRALRHIHGRKILHRDVKPANIFVFAGAGADLSSLCSVLTEDCDVKLGDFGLGKMFDNNSGMQSQVGSPSYFSPEICKGLSYGRRSDIWGLGVSLYELACLQLPFVARSVPAVAYMICKNEPAPIPDCFSPDLRGLMVRLMDKEPSGRPMADAILKDPFVRPFAKRFSGCASPRPTRANLEMAAVPEGSLLEASTAPALLQESPASGEPCAEHQAGSTNSEEAMSPPRCKAADEFSCDLERTILAVFRRHDVTGSGIISTADLELLLSRLGEAALTRKSIRRLLDAAVESHEPGGVDYQRFVSWLGQ